MLGKMLEIDLSSEKTKISYISKDIYKDFIGGKGLGAYLLFNNLKKGTPGLSEENPLIFLTGPLTGSGFPTSGRMVVVSKSPLTNTYTDSHAGGFFGNELKRAGYDVMIIKGKAKGIKYLWIEDDNIEFRDGSHVWGKETAETVERLREETNKKARVACIGPAGENLSLISAIMMDKDDDKTRAGIAGRTGLGAVMGSKNLKAVVLKGNQSLDYEKEDLLQQSKISARSVVKANDFMKVRNKYGSANLIGPMNETGFLPTDNFKAGFMENGEDLYCESMNKYKTRNATCHACSINCGQLIETKDKKEVKIEYESIALLGSNNGIKNFMDVAKACYVCNELGIDTMSAGVVVGFAMECKEKGILNEGPEFGDSTGQIKLLEDMTYRRGVGEILADGVKVAAEKICKGSEKFAIHVKGLEMAGYEPRTSWGMALAYATADRGACHQRCWTVNPERSGGLKMFSFEDKPEFVADVQNERAAAFSMLVCDFLPFEQEDIVDAFQGVTGIPFSVEDYIKAGERIWNLIKLFNLREGCTRKDDTLPYRMFNDKLKLPKGVYDIDEVVIPIDDFEKALIDYYVVRGWDNLGVPSLDKLEELGLKDYLKDV